jgi:hypothetical protein
MSHETIPLILCVLGVALLHLAIVICWVEQTGNPGRKLLGEAAEQPGNAET